MGQEFTTNHLTGFHVYTLRGEEGDEERRGEEGDEERRGEEEDEERRGEEGIGGR